MSWVYEQDTGKLRNPAGQVVAQGYAGGNCGLHPEGVNNHAMQFVHNIGPLPVGVYILGAMIPSSHLGPNAIPLIPHDGNVMQGRGHFYMHGDMIGHPGEGSDGCIIMPPNVRAMVAASPDKTLEVRYVGVD